MQTIAELFIWADTHNYPQLVLSQKDIIKPGVRSWMMLNNHPERVQQAIERIATFQKKHELAS